MFYSLQRPVRLLETHAGFSDCKTPEIYDVNGTGLLFTTWRRRVQDVFAARHGFGD